MLERATAGSWLSDIERSYIEALKVAPSVKIYAKSEAADMHVILTHEGGLSYAVKGARELSSTREIHMVVEVTLYYDR